MASGRDQGFYPILILTQKEYIEILVAVFEHFLTYIYESQPGLEEFEEKVDRIAEGEDDGDDSWISKIYNQFSFFNDGDNSLEENDMDGLEPPLLDETWGLGVRTQSKGETQFILDIYYSIWDDKKRLISADTQINGKVTIYTKCQPICCRQHDSGKKHHIRHL